MKPFLRWAGGKQNLIKDLIKFLPPEDRVNRYFEPFLGAGSMFFATDYEKCFLSDVNKDLINCYEAIKKNPRLIAASLERHKKNFEENDQYYYKVREKFNKNLEEESSVQAARFIFLIHSSFNGIYRVNLKGEYNVPIGKRKPSLPKLNELEAISLKLKGCYLSKTSYHKILTKIQEDDFVYLDPPYPPINETSFFQHYTKDKFSTKEQEKVRNFAKSLVNKKCFVMISNADTEMIRDLYRGWNFVQLQTTRYISCKSERFKVNELIITNY